MTQGRSNGTARALLGLVLMMVACGGGDADGADAGEAADTAAPAAPAPPPPAQDMPGERGYPTERTGGVAGVLGAEGEGERLALTVTDGDLHLSADSIGGGPTTLVIENRGTVRHTIEVFSEHYGRWRSAPVPPGGSASISMPLTYATYEVFCTIDGHRDQGEVVTLRVQ